MKNRFLYPAIFFISAAGIAYQMALMRILAIAQWHHFAYMVISMAMLGFAAGGTMVSLLRMKVAGKEPALLFYSTGLLTVSFILCYGISQKIPFETYQLISQPEQAGYLLCLYLVLAVPFFFFSVCLLLGILWDKHHVGRIYAVNMLGSGAGAAGVICLMFWMGPEKIPYSLTLVLGFAFLLLSLEKRKWFFQAGLFLVLFFAIMMRWGTVPIRVSEYKGLSYNLRLPGSEIVAQTQSPFSVITAVRSPLIRESPGQVSFRFPWKERGALPEQTGLFFDADSLSVINHFNGDLTRFTYLDYVTSALPYHLIKPGEVLVIGAGGGTDVLQALAHQADHVTAVEINPQIFSMIREHFRDFSGKLYDQARVTPVTADGREFLQAKGKFFDLIDIPPLDSFSAASAGVYALNESYLYTTEALGIYLNHLTPQGILSITRWVKTPPRDELKLFATMTEASERNGIREPRKHLAVIRSWNTVTLLLSRSPWSETQIQSLRAFLDERGFDAVYFPGMRPEERNRFVIVDDPVYDPMIPGLLGSDRKRVYRDYLFDIRPATDDRPYFFQFFKWQSLPRLLKGMGTEWVPFVEWGYLTLLFTFFQALPASLLIVLAPLFFRKPDEPMSSQPGFPVFLYFSGIGFGYMFLEIAFIQKFMLFLAYPIYAVAVVLASFLIFSGAGSYFADCYQGRKRVLVTRAVCFLAVLSAVYLAILPKVFESWIGWPRELKTVASIFLLAPLAFWMGVPFACGMQTLSDRFKASVPWAWAINGCASVLGAILAAFVAVHAGFGMVVFSAAGMYALALAGFLFLDQLKTP